MPGESDAERTNRPNATVASMHWAATFLENADFAGIDLCRICLHVRRYGHLAATECMRQMHEFYFSLHISDSACVQSLMHGEIQEDLRTIQLVRISAGPSN